MPRYVRALWDGNAIIQHLTVHVAEATVMISINHAWQRGMTILKPLSVRLQE